MKKGIGLLTAGLAVGAGLMYFFDPDRGHARRTMVRERTSSTMRSAGDAISKRSRNIGNRIKGIAHDTRTLLKRESEAPSDELLMQRVRSEIGHWVANAQAVEVLANQGRVVLNGIVEEGEMRKLLDHVKNIRGVVDIESHLQLVH
ncbi:MAG: BON domain-containing protein [Betaproteobacteria bacterium]|nr:BON domain-containing protein [Betaproteobacteria bacterium]